MRELLGWKRDSGQVPPDSGQATMCAVRLHAQLVSGTHNAGLRLAFGVTRKRQPAEARLHGEGRKECEGPARCIAPKDTKTQNDAETEAGRDKSDKTHVPGRSGELDHRGAWRLKETCKMFPCGEGCGHDGGDKTKYPEAADPNG